MADETKHYNFNLPGGSDFYNVDDQNENWKKIDEELANHTHDYLPTKGGEITGDTAVTGAHSLDFGKLGQTEQTAQRFVRTIDGKTMVYAIRIDGSGNAFMDLYEYGNSSDAVASYAMRVDGKHVFKGGDLLVNSDKSIEAGAVKLHDGTRSKVALDTIRGTADGIGVTFGAGGLTIVGGGEACSNVLGFFKSLNSVTDETTYGAIEHAAIAADSNVYLIANAQDANTDTMKIVRFSSGGNLSPNSTGSCQLGSSGLKWSQIWCNQSSLNSTSDARAKYDIETIAGYKGLIMGLKPYQFKYKDGESGRPHYGFLSQQVKEAMTAAGIEDCGFFLCDVTDEAQEQGITLENATEEQKVYGLRYSEAIAPLVAVVQEQEQEIKNLKEEMGNLKALVASVVKQ